MYYLNFRDKKQGMTKAFGIKTALISLKEAK